MERKGVKVSFDSREGLKIREMDWSSHQMILLIFCTGSSKVKLLFNT